MNTDDKEELKNIIRDANYEAQFFKEKGTLPAFNPGDPVNPLIILGLILWVAWAAFNAS